jgi:sortase A
VLSAHRDTHFAFLREITPGEELWLSERPGKTRRYRVAETAVVDSAGGPLLLEPALDALLLTTCYPFDALLPGGSERFVVLAYPAADPITQQQVVKL